MRPHDSIRRSGYLALLLLGTLAIAGNLEPPGPPAPTMKTIQQVEPRVPIGTIPVTIAAPGSYYLTGDMYGVAGQFGISITASHVTLDLDGHSLVGVPGSLNGIQMPFAGTKGVVVRNGTVRGWGGTGVAASIAITGRFEGLRVDGNGSGGLQAGPASIVEGCVAAGNVAFGIYADAGSTVSACTAHSNTLAGISTGQAVTVARSTALSNGTTGLALNAGSVAVECTAMSNSTGFIVGTGGRAVGCVARQNSLGMQVADGGAVERSTVSANSDDGIRAGSRCRLVDNHANGNTNDGIQATGSENRIEGNESSQNGAGIRVDGVNNLVVRNSVSSNTFEYLLAGGNQLGPISVDPATAGPWANFDK